MTQTTTPTSSPPANPEITPTPTPHKPTHQHQATATANTFRSVNVAHTINPADGKTWACDRGCVFESFVEGGRMGGEVGEGEEEEEEEEGGWRRGRWLGWFCGG
ncbi:hypothetical protein P153DRAFT_383944 [Dothidotthia symphoricarpi CBS 119687]|uniref:Uncharacterized protein n=1 Tax=Dothidotthia symphoricarpi CBS 119687 TaxID=1392245 RepID=A0A6A6AFN5_9PLEO|nr:uncharacterized protein P153DRAFT_383944 [Dothidotthia symphoricarpi CBS 119687]KAF2130719.1 hypothetical protein P153DRAFT_383944 [Dothidotthia symphoricarpi CBS 119687]